MGWNHSTCLQTAITVAIVVVLGASCTCTDPGKIDVTPDCPNGLSSSSLTVQYDLSKLNDRGLDKKVRVSGQRDAGQKDVCFAAGATNVTTLDLSGQGSGSQVVNKLQDGNWKFDVIVFEGASTPHPKRTVTGNLPNGGTKTVSISADAGGVLQVTLN